MQGMAEGASGSGKEGRKAIVCAIVPIFVLTFIAFALLTLATFSLPFVPALYFLRTSQAGGIRFGIWGWCLDEGICSDALELGYTWEPQINIPITKALALYPVAAVSAFATLIALLPILRDRSPRTLRVFAVFAWFSFTIALLNFVFMIAMWAVADERFKKAGWEVHWGPLPWMTFVATMLLLIVAINSWRGTLSTLCLPQDHIFSEEEDWETGQATLGLHETDLEKSAPCSPVSTLPLAPSMKEVSPASEHKKFVDVSLRSPKDEYPQPRRAPQERWSHRLRHDSFWASKYQRPRPGNMHSSDIPFPLTSNIPQPPRSLRQPSQKRHHSQLTPLRTT